MCCLIDRLDRLSILTFVLVYIYFTECVLSCKNGGIILNNKTCQCICASNWSGKNCAGLYGYVVIPLCEHSPQFNLSNYKYEGPINVSTEIQRTLLVTDGYRNLSKSNAFGTTLSINIKFYYNYKQVISLYQWSSYSIWKIITIHCWIWVWLTMFKKFSKSWSE